MPVAMFKNKQKVSDQSLGTLGTDTFYQGNFEKSKRNGSGRPCQREEKAQKDA